MMIILRKKHAFIFKRMSSDTAHHGLEQVQERVLDAYQLCFDEKVSEELQARWLGWRKSQDNFLDSVFHILIDMLWGLDSLETLQKIAPIWEISAAEDEFGHASSIGFRHWDNLHLNYEAPLHGKEKAVHSIRNQQAYISQGVSFFVQR